MSQTEVVPEALPLVTVILVNYRGADDTLDCLRHVAEVDWPDSALELIVVDNDSRDGSAERIRKSFPSVTVHESGANLGFAGGCNRGVALAHGSIVAFLNSDARPDRGWIRSAIQVLNSDAAVACVASRVLDWEGRTVDYVDGAMSWFGMGYKREVGQLNSEKFDHPKDVLFATGAAMFIRKTVYEDVGGFDERYFMFFEDVDLGWRLNVLGHKVRYVPDSIAFHRHHAAISKFGSFREQFLLERNALLTIYKNFGGEMLRSVFGPALVLALQRAAVRGKAVAGSLNLELGEGEQAKTGLTAPYAIADFASMLPSIQTSRDEIQAARKVKDDDIVELFRDPINALMPDLEYVSVHDALVDMFGLTRVFPTRKRVLVVTGDVISERMAGPAIRAWEMAKAISHDCDVRLISTTAAKSVDLSHQFEVLTASGPELEPHIDWADVLVFQGYLLWEAPWIVERDIIVVADIYDPFHLEQLEQARDLGEEGRRAVVNAASTVLVEQIRRADLMLCASEKQRAFWLGELAAIGRVNQLVREQYGAPEDIIRVVPFGLGDEPPVQSRHAIRGVVPGIGMEDKVIIWGGGVYNWFDPLTLVRAVARLAKRHSNVRLYFMGMKHPNPAVPEMKVATALRELSDELELTGKHVFFNSDWVEYGDRQNVLMDADVGVSTHFEHVETAYSFRTRILDYLWAGLPIVATTGDSFGDVLSSEGIGIGIPPEDVDALETALESLLYDEEFNAKTREHVRAFSRQFRWETVLEPLVEFCRAPQTAGDLRARMVREFPVSLARGVVVKHRLRQDLELTKAYLKAGGLRLVVSKARGRLEKLARSSNERS